MAATSQQRLRRRQDVRSRCQAISDTLKATGGNKSQAAKALRTDYKTQYLKMKNLGISGRE